MSLNVGQGAKWSAAIRPGSGCWLRSIEDTAKVNSYLHSADVQAVLPRNIKFLWEVKPIKNTKTLHYMPSNLQAPKTARYYLAM
jgi:SecD/SecF fusion protein